MNLRSGEKAQATEQRHEDLKSDLQHSHERPGRVVEIGEQWDSQVSQSG